MNWHTFCLLQHHVSGLLGDIDGNLTSGNGTDFDDMLKDMTSQQIYGFQLSCKFKQVVYFLRMLVLPSGHVIFL